MGHEPRFIRPTAPIAERAILVGDPGRALLLAQELIMTPPPMFNHHRGLWGYSGLAKQDGKPLLVQGTGLGAASLNAVVTDLIGLGVERMIRVGSCRAAGSTDAGALVIADNAIGGDGVSLALGQASAADAELVLQLVEALGGSATVGSIASHDLGHLVYGEQTVNPQVMVEGCCAIDMSTASLFATSANHGTSAAAVLVAIRDASTEISEDELERLVKTAGGAAVAALADA